MSKFKAPEKGLGIRMYRQGIGDCFLLAYQDDQQKDRYVLIDCGVHTSQKGGNATLRKVYPDLVKATGGKLDIVVATHEHSDHLSGFYWGRKTFEQKMEIDTLWLGWTEDRNNPEAEALRQKHGHAADVIQEALEKLRKKGLATPAFSAARRAYERVAGLMAFMNNDNPSLVSLSAHEQQLFGFSKKESFSQ